MKAIYVVKVGNLFYKSRHVNKSFVVTGDIQDAKWFYKKESAEMVAKESSGEVRDLIGVMMGEEPEELEELRSGKRGE